jgi:hypothetical protein
MLEVRLGIEQASSYFAATEIRSAVVTEFFAL